MRRMPLAWTGPTSRKKREKWGTQAFTHPIPERSLSTLLEILKTSATRSR